MPSRFRPSPMKRTLLALTALSTLAACGDSEESYEIESPVAASGASTDAFADQQAPVTNITPPGGAVSSPFQDAGTGGGSAGTPAEPIAPIAPAEPAEPPAPPVLSVDNHVEVVAALLDVYRGEAYRERLLEATRRARPSETGFAPSAAGVTPEAPLLDTTCSNGGTARFELVRDADREEGWNTTFEGCQDEADVLEGRIRRTRLNGGDTIDLDAAGFGVEGQAGTVSFDGNARWRPRRTPTGGTGRTWTARDMSFADTASDAAMTLDGADYRFSVTENAAGNVVRAELDGGFTMSSPTTDGVEVVVQTGQAMRFVDRTNTPAARGDAWTFEAGSLRATAADGSALLLQPANGDRDTVDVTITGNGETVTIAAPWSTWRENLRIAR